MPRNTSSRAYSIALDNLVTAMDACIYAATESELQRLNDKLETADPKIFQIRHAMRTLSIDIAEECAVNDGIRPYDAAREHGLGAVQLGVGGR